VTTSAAKRRRGDKHVQSVGCLDFLAPSSSWLWQQPAPLSTLLSHCLPPPFAQDSRGGCGGGGEKMCSTEMEYKDAAEIKSTRMPPCVCVFGSVSPWPRARGRWRGQQGCCFTSRQSTTARPIEVELLGSCASSTAPSPPTVLIHRTTSSFDSGGEAGRAGCHGCFG
jgi:hypothetical protein